MVSRMARLSALSTLVSVIALSTGSLARADEPAPTTMSPPALSPTAPRADATSRRTDHEEEEETSWYGWQTLIADGTSLIALPIAAGVTQSGALGGVALGGYLLAPPFIHGAHGRWGIFAASLGLRVGMPVVFGLLGAAVDDCKGELCIPVGAAFGVVLGALGAVALDASLLSFEKVEEDGARYRARRGQPSHVAWSPSIAPRKEGGFTLGLGASF